MLRHLSPERRTTFLAVACAAAAVVVSLLPGPARADDRDLLKDSSGDPYVFIIFDTSGSMNQSTRCTSEQLAAGECLAPCADRDCHVPLSGDDPASKFYQAKEALYEVIHSVDDINFGFSSYNQDGLFLRSKHFLYRASTPGPTVPGGYGAFPAVGETDVFGFVWICDTGSGDNNIGCYPNSDFPADLNDQWERTRVSRLPKGHDNFFFRQRFYVRYAGVVYWVEYRPVFGGALGDPTVQVVVDLERCNDISRTTSCSSAAARTPIAEATVTFDLVSDFVSWDDGAVRGDRENGYFPQTFSSSFQVAADAQAGGECAGWDPNDDLLLDPYLTYSLKFPTTVDPTFSPHLDVGDVIPLSWNTKNKQEILSRLAPNILLGEATPDFRVARYFRNQLVGSEDFLRLRNDNVRPLVPYGATPLGFALADFRTWWAGCEQGACTGRSGWSDIAAANDPDWACRKKYLLVISDGDDTCPGRDPCSFTAALRAQENVFTFVVAFGVQNTPGNRLTCMASNGGTGEPIYPQNKQQLVDALTSILQQIREEARSFASAAVPNVQAVVADKIFLSSFTPLNNESVWDGHLDAYLKPLVPDESGKPPRNRRCDDPNTDPPDANCLLWDVGEALLAQAPTRTELDAGTFRLGNNPDERRIAYPWNLDLSTERIPREMRYFLPPSGQQERRDIWDGLGIVYNATGDPDSPPPVLTQQVLDIIEQTLVQKEATINNPDGTSTDITYVFGDIFHSNPTVIDNPSDFRNFAADIYGTLGGTDCTLDANSNKGYRCFARKHEFRRKMVAVGANDGMLHFFNSGLYVPSGTGGRQGAFDNGDGSEILAVIPRLTLPIVKALAEGNTQTFGIDGSSRVIDVFIDPTSSLSQPPVASEREWRTIAVTGLREGGTKLGGSRVTLANGKPWTSGYFAVDITQPDTLNGTTFVPTNAGNKVPNCIFDEDGNPPAGGCGPVPFGTVLWEFTDSINGSPAEWGTAFDENNNSQPDLGDTWSTPILGRIKLLDGLGGTQDRQVAIFGGGFDRDNRNAPQRGTWLYMVDLETGKALYKRQLVGAAPANPAVVDTNRDGYFDAVYIGTTAGYLYKVDLTTPVATAIVNARDLNGNIHQVERITDAAWNPFVIFDTVVSGTRRPIFFAPTIISVAQTGQLALAFGTGDRELLWNFNNVEGRFYVIADEGFTLADVAAGNLPKDEGDYAIIDSEGAFNPGADFLVTPPANHNRGWVLTLDPNERVVAQAFSVAGITIFPTFKPQIDVQASQGNNAAIVCARTGDSRVFVVFSSNADAIQPVDAISGTQSRSLLVGEALVTPPYADQSATKNPGTGTPEQCQGEWRDSILATLEKLFPEGTRFANYTIEVNFIRSDTGIVCPIPVPIGIVEKNWREF